MELSPAFPGEIVVAQHQHGALKGAFFGCLSLCFNNFPDITQLVIRDVMAVDVHELVAIIFFGNFY